MAARASLKSGGAERCDGFVKGSALDRARRRKDCQFVNLVRSVLIIKGARYAAAFLPTTEARATRYAAERKRSTSSQLSIIESSLIVAVIFPEADAL
jgi:hypothetical protein